jgi:tyrosine-specific transport protein
MKVNHFLGAVMLVAGTAIGAGMLALPISTGPAGFWWAGGATLIAWAFMCCTGLLVLEVNLWFGGHTSYISMAKKTLGPVGAVATWLVFLSLLYSLMAAYIAGGSALALQAIQGFSSHALNPYWGMFPWVLVFAWIVWMGAKTADIVNRFMIIGMGIAYLVAVGVLSPHFSLSAHKAVIMPHYVLISLPIVLASYGYHIIIPTVSYYLKYDRWRLRLAIVLGSAFPLLIYLLWEALIFGVLPLEGKGGMLSILKSTSPTVSLVAGLSLVSKNSWLGLCVDVFAFFAIASSFIGVSLGLFDLWADGLRLKEKWGKEKHWQQRIILAVVTFIPPLVFVCVSRKGFLLALSWAGIFVAVLHGILPAIMVWSGRYWKGFSKREDYRVFGGRVLLIGVGVLSVGIILADRLF